MCKNQIRRISNILTMFVNKDNWMKISSELETILVDNQ